MKLNLKKIGNALGWVFAWLILIAFVGGVVWLSFGTAGAAPATEEPPLPSSVSIQDLGRDGTITAEGIAQQDGTYFLSVRFEETGFVPVTPPQSVAKGTPVYLRANGALHCATVDVQVTVSTTGNFEDGIPVHSRSLTARC